MAHPSPIVLAALVACAVFAAPAPALAANRAVTGSGDWHDPSIWERGRIAGERDRATVERGDVDVRRNVEVRELKIGADGDTVRSSVSVRDGSSFSAWRSVVVGDSAVADAAFVVDDGTLETAELWLNSGSKRGPGSRAELSVSGTLRTSAIVANAGTASGTVVVTQSGDVEVSGSIDLSSGNGASSWVVDGGSLSWGGTLIAGGPSQRDSFIVRSAGAAVSDGACAFGTGASIGFVLEPGGVAPIVCHGGASLAADIAEFRIDGSAFAPGKGRLPLVAGGALSNAFDLSRAVVTGFDTNEYEVRVIEDGGRIVLDTRIDAATGAVVVDIVPQGPGYPDFGNRYDLDEFQFDVSNPHDEAVNLPLVFNKVPPTAITGSVMTLAEYDSRALTGIAVQIAKNWHGTSTSEVHRGSWIRGSTMIRLEPGETRRLVLRSVDGYWGATPAASHSQLSLVGYEGNWKWDQLALGAWGESMALDPTLHLAGSFVADFRPAFTLPMNGSSDHNWTENLGGADFLVYFDADNTYRWLKRVKTAYLWTGPNLTRVLYSGVTDDDRIRVTYEFRVGSTFDHLRAFHRFRYEFLDDVTDPARLTYFQMAAEYYMVSNFSGYHIGGAGGLEGTFPIEAGGNEYKGAPHPFDGRWLSVDDNEVTAGDGTTDVNRGLILRRLTLNGADFPAFLHRYGRTWGASTMLFELGTDSVRRSYTAGDVVEGEIELMLTPENAAAYWGDDGEFRDRLVNIESAWQPVHDEFRFNNLMQVVAQTGQVLEHYPVRIAPADGQWRALGDVGDLAHDYYQGYADGAGGIDYVFTIRRPDGDLAEPWRLRFVRE